MLDFLVIVTAYGVVTATLSGALVVAMHLRTRVAGSSGRVRTDRARARNASDALRRTACADGVAFQQTSAEIAPGTHDAKSGLPDSARGRAA